MATTEPDTVDEYDGRTVETYRLRRHNKTSGRPDLLLNIEEDRYTAQWLSQSGIEGFREVFNKYASDGSEAVATFEPGCRSNFRDEGPIDELLSENKNYYPDECSYLRVENSGYNIAWEKEKSQNTITLSVDSNNTTPLEIYFAELWTEGRSDHVDELTDGASSIIDENI